MHRRCKIIFTYLHAIIWCLFLPISAFGQHSFWMPADTFDSHRFKIATISGVALYGATFYGLNKAWYEDQGKTKFHLFNDWSEWKGMDKAGHIFSTYQESRVIYEAARWTGSSDRRSLMIGVGGGMLIQTSIELLDGYAERWGFSWSDMAFNVLGGSAFVSQELLWGEQRISFKVSAGPKRYSTSPLMSADGLGSYSLSDRADDLFGKTFSTSFLKDYNAQTIWASVSPRAWLPQSKWPAWLQLSFGYGAENLYAGFGYSFVDPLDGRKYTLDPTLHPRYNQYFLSVDVDFKKIPTKSHFVKGLFSLLNMIKFPAPAMEFNSLGQVKGHPFYW